MGFDVSALANYTEEAKSDLITKAIFGGKTAQMMQKQTGIKSAQTINILESDVVFQEGSTCGFNASGTTDITQRTITVGHIKIHEALCPKDLDAKYTQLMLSAGKNDGIPMEQLYMNRKSDLIANALETAYWQSEDGGAGGAQLDKFDGFLHVIDDAGTAVDGNPTGIPVATGITSANVEGIFDGIYALIPAELLNEGKSGSSVKVWCGYDVYRTYITAIKDSNFFHFKADESSSTFIPGTNIEVVPTNGLNGTNRIIAGDPTNFFIGCDEPWESDEFKAFWAEEADEFRFMSDFKVGCQVAFPDQIVEFTLVP